MATCKIGTYGKSTSMKTVSKIAGGNVNGSKKK